MKAQGMYRLDIEINNISVLNWLLNLWWFRYSICGRDIFRKSMGFPTAQLKKFLYDYRFLVMFYDPTISLGQDIIISNTCYNKYYM